MAITMHKCRRYSGAFEFGFTLGEPVCLKQSGRLRFAPVRISDQPARLAGFGFQSIDKERWCKWPVAEYFAKHLLNKAEELNSQNVSKPLARIADCLLTTVMLSGVEVPYPYFSSGFQDATNKEGEMETRGNSRTSVSILNAVTLSGVEMLYPNLGSGFRNLTRREGEMETKENFRVSSSSLNVVTQSEVEVLYLYYDCGFRLPMQSEEMTRECGFETRLHSDRIFIPRPTSLVPLKRMHGKTNSNAGIPIKRVFTN